MYLAQDGARLVAVEQGNGFLQHIASKHYGESARDIKASVAEALREHAGLILPTVEECRAIIKERYAAERKAFELGQSTELSRTQGDIRLCYATTRGGRQFAEALEEKGLILARVSAGDAQFLDRPAFEEGELVVLNAYGGMVRINARTTGDARANIEARLCELDGNLPTVKACLDVLHERKAVAEKAYALEQSTELSPTQGDIRLCYAMSRNGEQFAAALEEKGLTLARVSAGDAHNQPLDRPALREGEFVVLNAYGDLYRINARTTGDERGSMEARLRELGNLRTVKACRAVLQERIAAERKAFALAQSMELSATQSDIRLCYAMTKGGKHFAQALEDKGIILAHVTRHEAESSAAINRLFLRDETKAFAPPVLKEGELVAVNALGNVYRFNARTTGCERANMEARLREVDRRELMTLSQAKEVLRDVQRQRAGGRASAGAACEPTACGGLSGSTPPPVVGSAAAEADARA